MGDMKALNEFCEMIATYSGRDKVMKVLCYSTKFISGLSNDPSLAKKYAIFSKKISGARATLRLIDDIPMLKYSLEYGLGKQEPDRAMSAMGIMANVVDHIYYPLEKICWLIEHQLLDVEDPNKWDTLNSAFWMSSIYLNLMRTLRMVVILEQHKNCIQKLDTNLRNPELAALLIKQRMEMTSVIRLSLDLIHAGSTLPRGYLWGGKLQSWHVGLIGTVSAFIGIYQIYAKKRIGK